MIFLFVSCASKKNITTTQTNIDTITKIVTRKVEVAIHDTINITKACVKGVLRPFDKQIKTNSVDIHLVNNNGTITLRTNIDSIVNSRVEKFKSTLKSKDKLVIKRIPNKYNWYSIILNVLLIAYILRRLFS